MSTSLVYLFRSMGSVWGVAAASTIIQNVLSSQLPLALSEIPDKLKVILFPSPPFSFPFPLSLFPPSPPFPTYAPKTVNKRKGIIKLTIENPLKIITSIRHSVTAINDLDPEVQEIARQVYFNALRVVFLSSTAWAAVALFAAFFARGQKLDRR